MVRKLDGFALPIKWSCMHTHLVRHHVVPHYFFYFFRCPKLERQHENYVYGIILIRKEHQTVGFRSENMQPKRTMPNELFLRKSMVGTAEKRRAPMCFLKK